MYRASWIMLAGVWSLVILASIAGHVSSAQGDGWEPLGGPMVPGGTVTALAIAPAAPYPLYAVLGERIYRSDDGADSWTPVYTATASIGALAVHPISPTVVYAGSPRTLLRTTDGGLTWQQVYNLGVAIAIDPQTPTTVYVCGSLGLDEANQPPAVVARSMDGGTTWTTVSVEGAWELLSLAVHPLTPTILYAGGVGQAGKLSAIYRSADAGLSWSNVLPEDMSHGGIQTILIDPTAPQVIYASDYTGLLKSPDGGASWDRLSGLPQNWHYIVALDPQVPTTLYAARQYPAAPLYKSTDGGASWWQSVNPFRAGVAALVVHPATPNILYAGLYDFGLHRSATGGGSWTETNTGVRTLARVDALAVDPATPDTIFAGSAAGRGGLFRSADGGHTWTTVLTDTPMAALAIHPLTPTLVFAGGGSALYQSTNGGRNWWRDYNASVGNCLAIDPTRDVLYAGGYQGDYPAEQGVVAWRYLSGWQQGWHTVPLSGSHSIHALAVHPITPTIVFAGSLGRHHSKTSDIYRSRDGGGNWTLVMSEAGYNINALGTTPHAPATIYASGAPGVYKSMDNGATWDLKPLPWIWMLVEKNDLAVEPHGIVSVGTGNGVYRSWDGGEHWASFGPEGQAVCALAVTPGHPQRLLAGAAGVWRRWETRENIYLPAVFK